VVPSAAPKEAQPRRSESKLKNWFRGRRRTGRGSRGERATEAAREQPQSQAQEETSTAPVTDAGAVGGAEGVEEAETTGTRDRSRSAALSSHPITGDELNEMQRRRSSVLSASGKAPQRSPTKEDGNGNRRSSWFRNSLMKPFSRNSETKTNGNGVAVTGGATSNDSEVADPSEAQQASTAANREDLRESAAEQGLPAPPAIGKEASNGTARESRFSEDL
jgi:hypothetical protein